ncbi:MAG TPA: hypothetical protein VGL82_16220 [Bryobacteraceae bacterium]
MPISINSAPISSREVSESTTMKAATSSRRVLHAQSMRRRCFWYLLAGHFREAQTPIGDAILDATGGQL